MKLLCTALLIGSSALAGAACTTTRAATPIERPALEVPPPPPRVIVPLPPPDQPYLEPVAELPTVTGNSSPTKPRPAQREKPEPPKPDPKTEAPPDQPPPANPPAQVPQLRTPETANADQLRNQIQDTINRARAILDKVDAGSLKDPRRKAFEDARLFAQQADAALKESNLVFARELADKAERYAKEFQGR
jgi:hypothetical protein